MPFVILCWLFSEGAVGRVVQARSPDVYYRPLMMVCFLFNHLFIYFFTHFYFPASGQAVVTWSQVSSLLPPGSCLQLFIAHRVQQSHCSSIFHRVLLTHALALSASQYAHKKSPNELIRVALGGTRTHETDLYQARG